MPAEKNANVIRQWIDLGLGVGDWSLVETTFSDDYRFVTGGNEIKDRERLKATLIGFRAAFPDLSVTIEDLVAEGDRVVVRTTYRGIQHGSFMGVSPTHREIVWTGITIYRLMDELVIEEWAYWDSLRLAEQLGLQLASG